MAEGAQGKGFDTVGQSAGSVSTSRGENVRDNAYLWSVFPANSANAWVASRQKSEIINSVEYNVHESSIESGRVRMLSKAP